MLEKKLIWSDEFDYEGKPDPSKWNYDIGAHHWGNDEAQYYTDHLDNSYVKDGKLHIVAKKEDMEDCHYTSARLITYKRQSWKYGRFEICAKLPEGKGTWPAIWMLADSIKEGEHWPRCGEIDIMEHVGRDQDVVFFSLHSELYNHHRNTQPTLVTRIADVSKTFNVYGFDWTPDYIEFFVNDQVYVRFDKGQNGNDTTNEGWPFEKPFYLILNIAVGGFLGGPVDDSILPQKMEVDYVRVYELTEK